MILPTTASTVWILAIVALLCLGSWANTYKLSGKWRFEYYYYDFVFGLLLTAGVAALLLGSARPAQITLQDNLLLTGYRKMAWAVGSGIVLNLGMMLLLAAISVSGMSVAFPLAFGAALVIGTIWDFAITEHVNITLTFEGIILLLAAMTAVALAHVRLLRVQREAVQMQTALRVDPRAKTKRNRTGGGAAALILALASGVVLSTFPRALSQATLGENGIAPYPAVLLLTVGTIVSVPFFVLFFTTFPVAGIAGKLGGYLSGTKKQHLLGVAGGIVWGAGMLSSLLITAAPPDAQLTALVRYPLSNGVLLIAAAWGLLVWREIHGGGQRVRLLVAGMVVLFMLGMGIVAFAFTQK